MVVGNHTLPSEILRTCTDGFLICFSDWAFEVTQGTFWMLALASFCIILIMATYGLGMKRAFGYGSFVGLLGSVWLTVMGLMSWWTASIFIILGFIGIAILVLSEN